MTTVENKLFSKKEGGGEKNDFLRKYTYTPLGLL